MTSMILGLEWHLRWKNVWHYNMQCQNVGNRVKNSDFSPFSSSLLFYLPIKSVDDYAIHCTRLIQCSMYLSYFRGSSLFSELKHFTNRNFKQEKTFLFLWVPLTHKAWLELKCVCERFVLFFVCFAIENFIYGWEPATYQFKLFKYTTNVSLKFNDWNHILIALQRNISMKATDNKVIPPWSFKQICIESKIQKLFPFFYTTNNLASSNMH